jgi:hypothetical protein
MGKNGDKVKKMEKSRRKVKKKKKILLTSGLGI